VSFGIPEMTPEHEKLLTDFGLATFSGAVAGLVAGLILLWRQFGMELAKDDAKCILDILHMIDGARIEVSDAFWNVRFAEISAKLKIGVKAPPSGISLPANKRTNTS